MRSKKFFDQRMLKNHCGFDTSTIGDISAGGHGHMSSATNHAGGASDSSPSAATD